MFFLLLLSDYPQKPGPSYCIQGLSCTQLYYHRVVSPTHTDFIQACFCKQYQSLFFFLHISVGDSNSKDCHQHSFLPSWFSRECPNPILTQKHAPSVPIQLQITHHLGPPDDPQRSYFPDRELTNELRNHRLASLN